MTFSTAKVDLNYRVRKNSFDVEEVGRRLKIDHVIREKKKLIN